MNNKRELYQLFTNPTPQIIEHFRNAIVRRLTLNIQHYSNKLVPLDFETMVKRKDLNLISALYFILVWISIDMNQEDLKIMLRNENEYIHKHFPIYIREIIGRCLRGVRLEDGEVYRKVNVSKGILPPTHEQLMTQNTFAVVKLVRDWYMRNA
jgi:hypothetical protein